MLGKVNQLCFKIKHSVCFLIFLLTLRTLENICERNMSII
jgi:hypothetical protein